MISAGIWQPIQGAVAASMSAVDWAWLCYFGTRGRGCLSSWPFCQNDSKFLHFGVLNDPPPMVKHQHLYGCDAKKHDWQANNQPAREWSAKDGTQTLHLPIQGLTGWGLTTPELKAIWGAAF